MNTVIEESTNANLIRDIMIEAFGEYRNDPSPSSALDETVEMISSSLLNGEKAFISLSGERAAAMVRFQVKDNYIYFSRLSVLPEFQGKGIAKGLLKRLEDYAHVNGICEIQCKVRVSVPRNMYLYQSIGYEIIDQETVHKPNNVELQVVSMRKQL